jgi:hypothetical protein
MQIGAIKTILSNAFWRSPLAQDDESLSTKTEKDTVPSYIESSKAK